MNEAGHFILLFQPFFTYFGVECYRFFRGGRDLFLFFRVLMLFRSKKKREEEIERNMSVASVLVPFFPLHGERGRPGETCEPEGPFLIVNIPSVAASVWALLENILSEPLVSPRDLNSYFHLL